MRKSGQRGIQVPDVTSWPLAGLAFGATLGLTLFGAGSVAAQVAGSGPRGPGAELRPAGDGWRSVGRLDIGGQGFCTVTLIAPDRVLTAAHCLEDSRTGRAHSVGDLRVALGLRDNRAEITRGVRSFVTLAHAPDRAGQAGEAEPLARVPADLAVLELDDPVGARVLQPMAVSRATGGAGSTDGQVLSVVSFAQGRSREAALQDDCILIQRQAGGSLMLDCNVDHGASGSPVIAMGVDGPRVVAVISARAEIDLEGFPRAAVALAAPLDSDQAQRMIQRIPLANLGTGAPTGALTGAPTVRIRRPEGASAETGARFVRPAPAVSGAAGGAATGAAAQGPVQVIR